MAGTPNEPKTAKGRLQKLNNIGSPAFMAFDVYSRVKEGENVPVALGKAMLTNLAWGLVPGGFVGGMAAMAGIAAVQAGPMVARAIDQARTNLNSKQQMFGSQFQQSAVQMDLAQQGLNQINQARAMRVRQIANHARGAQQIY